MHILFIYVCCLQNLVSFQSRRSTIRIGNLDSTFKILRAYGKIFECALLKYALQCARATDYTACKIMNKTIL